MTENNTVIQRIKDFEGRYFMKFKISFNMCKKLGIQRKRLQKILDGNLEPTMYECIVFDKFLHLPK